MTKTVLITGTSSGFGEEAVKLFHEKGWNVVATMRSPERCNSFDGMDRVLVTRLDVIDVASVEAAVAAGAQRFGSIDVLVNNAGRGAHGLFEQYSAEEALDLYNTNVFGTMNVCRAVMPLMRQQRSGVIINVTSVAGLIGTPGSTIYSGTKFALEGFSEALALESRAWGIRVHTVAPGAFATAFSGASNDAWDRGDGDYAAYAVKLQTYMETTIANMRMASGQQADPREVAEAIHGCAITDMPLHCVAGADARGLRERLAGDREAFLRGLMQALPGAD